MSDLSAGQSVPSGSLATDRIRRFALDLPGNAIVLIVRGAIGLALLYAATIGYGIVAGYALPTSAVFHIVPRPGLIVRVEDNAPWLILALAALGAIFGWLRYCGVMSGGAMRQNQIVALRLLRRWGLFLAIAAGVLVLSNAWSGLLLGNDFQYASIGGLIPHSDAAIYFWSPMEHAVTGSWGLAASHRPFAAAFRELIMAPVGLSYVWTLLIQAVLVFCAFYAAARSIALWRGLWCALAFSALTYVLIRPFVVSVYTEALGLFWGLLSVMFFAESMRSNTPSTQANSLIFALLSLATLTLGEMTRMGSMFTIPAFVLWIALAYSTTISGRLKLFCISSGIVVLVIGAQALLAVAYSNPSTTIGSNFSYTLCGLAVGADWTACPKLYAAELGRLTTEQQQSAFLYSKALTLITQNPAPMLKQLLENMSNLFGHLPGFMMYSYLEPRNIAWWPLAVLMPGLWWALWYRGSKRELLFWALILISIAASAALIFADDGWRVFYVTWPYVALFASLGFASPGVLRVTALWSKPLPPRYGAAFVVIVLALFVITPAATRALYGPGLKDLVPAGAQGGSEETVLIGRTLTGFAVISDNAPLPKVVPAIHESDFRRIAERIGIERDLGTFVDAALKHVPFAFITAARIDHPGEEQLFIAPMQILNEPKTFAWRVTFGSDIRLPVIHDISAYQPLHATPLPRGQQP